MLNRRMLLRSVAAVALALPWLAAAQGPGHESADRRAADPAKTLAAHRWTLQSAADGGGQPIAALVTPGRAVTLLFDGPRVHVQGACNAMNGEWRIDPQGRLAVGRLASTMIGCPRPLMQADAALSELLAQPLEVTLQPDAAAPSLRLVAPSKAALVLEGRRTPESLYGAPTRIFLEVAAQPVRCRDGAGAGSSCLQVRERRYDEQGLPVGTPGEWRVFGEPIEGYAHTPGVRNVLRLKRFTRDPAPAQGPAYVYVLDLVVESEAMPK